MSQISALQYQNTLAFAQQMDEQDKLNYLRDRFLIPKHNGRDAIYLCGNSLGLQPKAAKVELQKQLDAWQNHAVEGWFDGDDPWLNYQQQLKKPLSMLIGAQEDELTVMNSLTVNLHLLFVSFYQPKGKRVKILMEGKAFPSDQYAIESQVRLHDLNPDEVIVEVFPRAGEYTLRTEDILQKITELGDELALVLFGGVNYYTGQLFDMPAITKSGHAVGAYVGFDLAHAAGNVPLQMHNWDVDFACWCSYKYMNSGPGGISGIFVHQKHFGNSSLKRLAGWWGYERATQFGMKKGFVPEIGADGWQVSTSPVLLVALNKAALGVFREAGDVGCLREKSLRLTAYMEVLIKSVNEHLGKEWFIIITPADPNQRGCQLSVICKRDGKKIFDYLTAHGVIGDWREPDVIRLSPVPLYNTFTDVYHTGRLLKEAVLGIELGH